MSVGVQQQRHDMRLKAPRKLSLCLQSTVDWVAAVDIPNFSISEQCIVAHFFNRTINNAKRLHSAEAA